MEYKTFKDYGLVFEEDTKCSTCKDGGCHTNVTSLRDGREYNVHISINASETAYSIYATESANTFDATTIDKTFSSESEAVKFLCESFERFKCF